MCQSDADLRWLVNSKPSTKLVQCELYWTALYKVGDDKFVRLMSRLPTSVRTIEANHVRCSRNTLDARSRFSGIADDYERKTRMPVADLHATNTAVDNAISESIREASQVCMRGTRRGHGGRQSLRSVP